MKFDSTVINILKNFSAINKSILFRAGNVISTVSESKTVIAFAKIKENIPLDFGIYDLTAFINVLSLFEEYDLEINDKYLIISGNDRVARYTLTDASMITLPPSKAIPSKNPQVTFNLSKEQLSSVQKALAVMSLPEIVISSDDGKIFLAAANSKEQSSDKFSICVGTIDKEFHASFKPENIKLMAGDYKVEVFWAGYARFSTEELEYFVTVEEADSKFE